MMSKASGKFPTRDYVGNVPPRTAQTPLQRYAAADRPAEAIRSFELPQPAYQLVEDVKARMGANVASEVSCILRGQITGFCNTSTADQETVERLARARGVTLARQ